MLKAKKKEELRFEGIAAAPGFAIGKAITIPREALEINKRLISPKEVETEIQRFIQAINATRQELAEIKKRVLHRLGEKDARLFDAHLLILDDQVVQDETTKRIRQERHNSEWVYFDIMMTFHDSLLASKDEYLKERAVDILDVKRRVLRNLLGHEACLISPSSGLRIVVAHQLTPSQTVLLDRNVVLGFAVDLGGRTSHVAILAKGLEKPAVVGLKDFADQVENNDHLIVDGNNGLVIKDPSKSSLLQYRKIQERYQHFLHDLIPIKDLPAKTLDGHVVELSANIELPAEVALAKLHGAEGIGLFRTEYLYLSKKDFPSEAEQYEGYRKVVDEIYPNSVIIRTFDLGGDRLMIGSLTFEERNPFLGWRSIRISLDLPEVFLTQLRAILRSSERQNIRVMLPMISSIEEVEKCKDMLEQAKDQLDREGIAYDPHIEFGIMVEIPATVMIADHLAKMVDFFSIGTNDLIQYSLAVDRGNERIAALYTNYHPGVLRLIKQTVDIGHQNNIWVGLCGEMARDPFVIPFLVGVGLDELSMTPANIPEVKKIIRSIRYNSAKRLLDDLLRCAGARDVKNRLTSFLNKELPAELRQLLPDSGTDLHNHNKGEIK